VFAVVFLIVCVFLVLCHSAAFLRLRRGCHIRNLLEPNRNLDQFLSTSDARWLVSDQFEVTWVGVHSLQSLGCSQKLHSLTICISLTCQSHLNLTRISSSPSFYSHLSRICFSLSSYSHLTLISLISRASHSHPTLFSLSTRDSSKVVQDFVHQPSYYR
jgi:hypothetical protein